jgi:hypothetical protein
VCTCRRWGRVTGRLIAGVEDSALLDDTELDELAEVFLAHEQAISYPLAWVSPEWLEVDLDDGTAQTLRSMRTRSQHIPRRSRHRCAGGQQTARCARARHGSKS